MTYPSQRSQSNRNSNLIRCQGLNKNKKRTHLVNPPRSTNCIASISLCIHPCYTFHFSFKLPVLQNHLDRSILHILSWTPFWQRVSPTCLFVFSSLILFFFNTSCYLQKFLFSQVFRCFFLAVFGGLMHLLIPL